MLSDQFIGVEMGLAERLRSVTLQKPNPSDPPEQLAKLQEVYEQLRQAKIENSDKKLVNNPVAEIIKDLENGENKVTIRAGIGNGIMPDSEHEADANKPGVGCSSTISIDTTESANRQQNGESPDVKKSVPTSLAHEIFHAWKMARGEWPNTTGAGDKEDIDATKFENQLRAILGMKLRKNYGTQPLPPETSVPSTTAP
jgi:hypothetical protein